MVPADALIPIIADIIYVDLYGIRHEEADAVSRAQRIISGDGTGRLWRILAQDVVQRARVEWRLDVITAAYGRRPAVWV